MFCRWHVAHPVTTFENAVHETIMLQNKLLAFKASLIDIWSHFSRKKCRSVYDRGRGQGDIRINTVHTNYEAKRRPVFLKTLIVVKPFLLKGNFINA